MEEKPKKNQDLYPAVKDTQNLYELQIESMSGENSEDGKDD